MSLPARTDHTADLVCMVTYTTQVEATGTLPDPVPLRQPS
jgi:hypothetical protein